MKLTKNGIKYIKIIVICVFCSYITTLATNYAFDSGEVSFNNTGTSISSTNVQDALGDTFDYVTNYSSISSLIGSGTLDTIAENLIDAVNEEKESLDNHFGSFGTSDNPITDLNELPLNSLGYMVLDASINPSGYKRSFSFWKGGTDAEDRYIIVALDRYDFKLYMYDMYDGTSKGWKNMSESYIAKNDCIPTGTNLNNIYAAGVYYACSSNSYTNMPDSKTTGLIEVVAPYSTGTYARQVFYYGGSAIYVRYRNESSGTAWGAWRKFAGTAVT